MREFILTTLVTLLISTGFSQTIEDSIKVKRNSIGFNLGGLYMTSFKQSNMNGTLSLKYNRMMNKRVLRVSLNNKIQEFDSYQTYTFDIDSIPIFKTHQKTENYYNVRVGLSRINHWGYGQLILSMDLILGYSKMEFTTSEGEDMLNNGVIEGYGIISKTETTNEFIDAGIDFSIAYEVDLSNRLALSLEFIPELVLYSPINKDLNNSLHIDFNDIFALNIFYRF